MIDALALITLYAAIFGIIWMLLSPEGPVK